MRSRQFFVFLLLAILSLVFSGTTFAAESTGRRNKGVPGQSKKIERGETRKSSEEHPVSVKSGAEVSPGQVSARGAILMEVSTGAILSEQSADDVIEPASFTKVMTLYLVFEAIQQSKIKLTDELWVSEAAWRTGGSKMFIAIGTKVPLEELIKGIAVLSGNDACVVVAEHLAGSQEAFVDAMNRKAAELGMTRTHFSNPHGLPSDNQVTSARDMAILDSAYLRRFPEALRYHSMHDYTYNNITQYNRNHLLLKDSTVDGLKTGYVTAAGYHLSGTAQRDGMRLLAVVMGTASPNVRERETMKLLNFGFRNFALVKPFAAGQPVAAVKVWKGEKNDVNLYPVEAASFLIPQAQKNQLKWELKVPEELEAPVATGQPVGQLVFTLAGEAKRTVSLVSQEDVPLGSWFKRLYQSVLRIHKVDWRWAGGIFGGFVLLVVLAILIANRKSFSRRTRPI